MTSPQRPVNQTTDKQFIQNTMLYCKRSQNFIRTARRRCLFLVGFCFSDILIVLGTALLHCAYFKDKNVVPSEEKKKQNILHPYFSIAAFYRELPLFPVLKIKF